MFLLELLGPVWQRVVLEYRLLIHGVLQTLATLDSLNHKRQRLVTGFVRLRENSPISPDVGVEAFFFLFLWHFLAPSP